MSNSPRPKSAGLAYAASIFAGAMVALQSRVNGELGVELGDGALAALISFGSGFAILGFGMVLSGHAKSGFASVFAAVREGSLDRWALLGGLGGAFLVLSQGLTAGVLGVALFSVAVVAGQTLGALGIDSAGLFGTQKVTASAQRLIGAGLVVVGVVVGAQVFSPAVSFGVAFLLPLVAGIGTGVQQALNGRVREVARSALAATFINFGVGTFALAIVVAVLSPLSGGPSALPQSWWLYTGGAVGAVFIAIQTVTVKQIGVLGLGVSLVTGQVIAAIGLDILAPVAGHDLGPATIVGALLAVMGSVLVALGRKSSR